MACSDGTTINNSTKLKDLEQSLKRLQRKLSRRVNGSKSRNETRLEIQKLHLRISNSRKDTLHKATSLLTKTKLEGTIVLEDLNVSGMLKNHKLSKAISNVGLFEFRRQIEYKSKWYGKTVRYANRFFPSSKLCSSCGSLKEDLKLSDRTYKCDCGNEIDRDLNAAINIRDCKNTVSSTGINAGVSDKQRLKRVERFIAPQGAGCFTMKPEINNGSSKNQEIDRNRIV